MLDYQGAAIIVAVSLRNAVEEHYMMMKMAFYCLLFDTCFFEERERDSSFKMVTTNNAS